MRFDDNYGGDPNYVNSSLQPTKFYPEVKGVSPESLSLHTEHEKWVGEVAAYSSRIKDDDFVQPAALWDVIGRDPGHQERTIDNLAGSISGVKSPRLRNEVYGPSALSFNVVKLTPLTHMQHSLAELIRTLGIRLNGRPRHLSRTEAFHESSLYYRVEYDYSNSFLLCDQIDSNVTIYQLPIGTGKPSSPKYSIQTRLSDDSDNNLRE